MEVAQQVRGVSSRPHAGFNTEMVHDLGDFGDIPVFRKPRFMYIYILYNKYIYIHVYIITIITIVTIIVIKIITTIKITHHK
jgi:hypothetical protein